MSKKTFFNPVILLSGIATPTDDSFDSDTTGQGGFAPYPMAYGSEWITLFGDDYDVDEEDSTPKDYLTWWQDQMSDEIAGFTEDAYSALNGVTYPALPNP